jgi:hypothetical protein
MPHGQQLVHETLMALQFLSVVVVEVRASYLRRDFTKLGLDTQVLEVRVAHGFERSDPPNGRVLHHPRDQIDKLWVRLGSQQLR